MMERRGPDPAVAVMREIRRRVPDAELVTARQRPWASVTYSGVQLSMVLTSGQAGPVDRLMLDLPEMDWRLPGHIMADVAGALESGAGGTVTVRIEALVLAQE
ncbi:hypothetical protein GGR88_001800 [Sphingomonas jejuensis]|uniref:Uncharacterized protein n=1 Tax=Sphingomonas jejuensis TaxID=904715 RepID=A0ABX0XNQ7_9SPHN|nr:hypothetical protein [Sphingomonas jejuensis]NJC34326.1 hypothetical protein [Sphingomonas jejuensis]